MKKGSAYVPSGLGGVVHLLQARHPGANESSPLSRRPQIVGFGGCGCTSLHGEAHPGSRVILDRHRDFLRWNGASSTGRRQFAASAPTTARRRWMRWGPHPRTFRQTLTNCARCSQAVVNRPLCSSGSLTAAGWAALRLHVSAEVAGMCW